MTTCAHCGTEFAAKDDERYCCAGCRYVAGLIAEHGFDRFYDLKGSAAVSPVRGRPFEEHDFGWLAPRITDAEAKARGSGSPAQLDLGLDGISCVGCVWLVEKLFASHPGGIRAVAQPAAGSLHVEWVPGNCDVASFLRELTRFGYVAAPAAAAGGGHERRRLAARLGLCGAFALNTMGFSLPEYLGMPADFEYAGLFKLIAFLSATLSMLVGSGYFIDRAWRAAKAGSMHIDLPIALGLCAAYLGSIVGWALGNDRLMYFDFVSTFVFLMLAGRYLQTAALDRNRRRLLRRQPVPSSVPNADAPEQPIARDAIAAGTRFLIDAGQALPVAAVLTDGESEFSLEWIHGEADPLRFTAGSRLPAGAILLGRTPVAVEATEAWRDSLMDKLTAPSAVDRGSPGLDRLLRVYLSVVLVTGLVVFAAWGTSNAWLTGLQAMISIFVVSCPCALGVAIPLADDLAAAAVERRGVFVRTVTLWSRLRRIRQVIFDKTGTLTLERPVLENPESVAALDDDAALALARMTRGSLHPAARTLLEALGSRGQKLLRHHGDADVRDHPGLGVTLDHETGRWSLGRAGWTGGTAAESAQPTEAGSELRHLGRLVASFRFRESLRPEALRATGFLQRAGMTLHILSGDHPDKVRQMADRIGLDHHHAHGGLNPQEKESRVKSLDRHDTLYLGDGANDSLAFDAAYVTGTPVVDRSLLESKADFYTLGSGMGFLPGLFDTAFRRSLAVRSAFVFALIYNVTAIAFSAAGMMSPLLAAVIMPLSSIVSIVIIVVMLRKSAPEDECHRFSSAPGIRAQPARQDHPLRSFPDLSGRLPHRHRAAVAHGRRRPGNLVPRRQLAKSQPVLRSAQSLRERMPGLHRDQPPVARGGRGERPHHLPLLRRTLRHRSAGETRRIGDRLPQDRPGVQPPTGRTAVRRIARRTRPQSHE